MINSHTGLHLLSAEGVAALIVYYSLEQNGTVVRKFIVLDMKQNRNYTNSCK